VSASLLDTDLGKGSLIWDKKERRMAFWRVLPFLNDLSSASAGGWTLLCPDAKALEEWKRPLIRD